MSKYDKIKDFSESEFKRLTGVKKQTFSEMITILMFIQVKRKDTRLKARS